MAGNLALRELTDFKTDGVRFAVATPEDGDDIRALLRETPMPGKISLSLEREPDFFADGAWRGENKQTIIARGGHRLACVGSCTIRQRFVNGKPCRVGYLGGLRLETTLAGRFDILRRGYEFFQELQTDAPADFYFTSIASDNARARQFLERGLRGVPRYQFLGEFVTLLIPASRNWQPEFKKTSAQHPDLAELVAVLNEKNSSYQFAPCWTVEELSALEILGLRLNHFQVVSNGGSIEACAALWDQRSFKQSVIRGYEPPLAQLRSVLNFVADFTDRPKLPAVGEILSQGFISHVAIASNRPECLIQLITHLRGQAAERGIALLTMGFDSKDPSLAGVKGKFRVREYRSCLYLVSWPQIGAVAQALDSRLLAPEVALL